MSETFEKIVAKDDRLGCITSKVKYQVFKGGQNITSQPFKAIPETPCGAHLQRYRAQPGDHHQQGGAVAIHGDR